MPNTFGDGVKIRKIGVLDRKRCSTDPDVHTKKNDFLSIFQQKNSRTPLQNFLGIAEEESSNIDYSLLSIKDASPEVVESSEQDNDTASNNVQPAVALTPEEYFSEEDLNGRDVGRPKKINAKVTPPFGDHRKSTL